MIKSIVVHDIPIDAIPAMERWYHRDHSAEIARRYGPWLARHESYLPVDAPADARAFGFYNWRVTEAFEGLVSSFLLERPNDEFLRDLRAYTP